MASAEQQPLDEATRERWDSRLEAFFGALDRARDGSKLPENAPDPRRLDAWLVELRLGLL